MPTRSAAIPNLAGRRVIFQVRTTRPKEVPQLWYTVRKKVGTCRYTLPQGVQGRFQRRFRRCLWRDLMRCRLKGASAMPSSRPWPTMCVSNCCRCPMWPRLSSSACRTKKVYVELSHPPDGG